LHPSRFKPDIEIVKQKITLNRPFYLIRLVSLTAGHDLEKRHQGINEDVVQQLIDILSMKGDVYISSEAPVRKEFEKYILKINPELIHHFIFYADLFIADSQSMVVESAILGTPSIRFNSFVGEISVLEELEKKYSLTYGVKSSEPATLFALVRELLSVEDLKTSFQERRQVMLGDKIDLTNLMISLFSNFSGVKHLEKDSLKLLGTTIHK
jgi:predicted glycosyltransferase